MTTKSLVSVISVIVIAVAALVGGLLAITLRTPVAQTSIVRNSVERRPSLKGPGVVRVSVIDGSTVIQRGDSHVQTSAVRNAPMLPGDYISTGNASRAELQFDGFTAIRLGEDAQARIVSNDSTSRKMQLALGAMEIGMVRDGQAMQVDTPSVTVRTRQAGDVRISTAADGSSWVTARRGTAEVITPAQTYTIGTDRTLIARGSASNPSITFGPTVAFDSFDDFSAARDNAMVAALNASPNLSPTLAGYEDLSAYGEWQTVPGYGQSWVPNEPAGWVPYRNGSWAWEGGYGWTWIGSEPWGWTPYHYGNWYHCGCGTSGWAWLPPANAGTPTWSPALVGFFGFDPGTAVSYDNCGGNYGPSNGPGPAAASYNAPAPPSGNGAPEEAPYSSAAPAPYGEGGPSPGGYNYPAPYGAGGGYQAPYAYPYPYIGWVPIAPYEPYYPWYPGWASIGFGWGLPFFGGYGYPASFATNITRITNITNITRIYRNFRYGGATGTTTRNFRHGTISGHTVPVTTRDVGRRFGTIHGAVPITPTRNNLAFSHGTVHAPVAFSKAFDSPRFASDKALAERTSFAQQQRGVAQAIRGGLTGHPSGHAAVARAHAPVSHANVAATHTNPFQPHENEPVARENAAIGHANAPVAHQNAPVARQNAPVARENTAPVARENTAPVARQNAVPAMRSENNETMRENDEMREGSAESGLIEAPRSQFAPATSWDRFDEARGGSRSAEFPAGSGGGTSAGDRREGEVAPSESGRAGEASSDPWGRFSASRGEPYGSMRNPYDQRESTPSYAHEAPSYSRDSYGSPYSRGSYGSPYSRGYPSYSHGSYPSYSHGSYPSYSRGSYPSYSHGSYPSYSHESSPSYSHGSGGGGAPHGGGGGRPPHT
jgi:hypothetical protein